jgi:hypothetical protein
MRGREREEGLEEEECSSVLTQGVVVDGHASLLGLFVIV